MFTLSEVRFPISFARSQEAEQQRSDLICCLSRADNLIVGSYDKRLVWHDLDLSTTPYKTLRYHTRALRAVSFSPAYPLFLSASDDGDIHVFHATVYADLLTNPLIVPLKVLKGHAVTDGLGVLGARWHPREPWLVSVGADGNGRLWCT